MREGGRDGVANFRAIKLSTQKKLSCNKRRLSTAFPKKKTRKLPTCAHPHGIVRAGCIYFVVYGADARSFPEVAAIGNPLTGDAGWY